MRHARFFEQICDTKSDSWLHVNASNSAGFIKRVTVDHETIVS